MIPINLLDASMKKNVLMQVRQLKSLEVVLTKRVGQGSNLIFEGAYDLNIGSV